MSSVAYPTHDQSALAGPVRPMPAWLRYLVLAGATLILCSCTSTPLRPDVRLAGDPSATAEPTWRGQSPSSAAELPLPPSPPPSAVLRRRDERLRRAQADLPTHLTSQQIAQASAPLENCPPAACSCASCCNSGPVRGPNDEYLCDGGDYGLPAGVQRDYDIKGLEQEDTIAHYETVDGRTIVTPSNKVCIYSPRFAAIRRVIDLHATTQALMPIRNIQQAGLRRIDDLEATAARLVQTEPSIDRQRMPPSLLRERDQPGELNDQRRVAAALGSLAPYANLKIVTAGELIGEERVRIARASLAAIEWAGDQAPQVILDSRQAIAEVSVQSPGVIYHDDQPNNPRLRLLKLADKGWAQQGEEIEFTLRFDNIGDRVMGNVTIVDNLTTRLEYVPDSQKSTVKADFKTKANNGGSLVLRWEIIDPLEPGTGGVIQFRCRVR